jgi:hypothetical protein
MCEVTQQNFSLPAGLPGKIGDIHLLESFGNNRIRRVERLLHGRLMHVRLHLEKKPPVIKSSGDWINVEQGLLQNRNGISFPFQRFSSSKRRGGTHG